MTKQEIEQAGEEYRDINFNNEIEYESLKKAFIDGAEMVNSKQPHTAENMEKSFNLLKKLRWTYLFDIDADGEPKSSYSEIIDLWKEVNELLKLWEEQR